MKVYLIKSEDFPDVIVLAPNMGYAVRAWLLVMGRTAKFDNIEQIS